MGDNTNIANITNTTNVTKKTYKFKEVFETLSELIPSYYFFAEAVSAYLNKYPEGCQNVSYCDQIIFDVDTNNKILKDGIMFACDDKLTFIGFGRDYGHTLYETTHFFETIEHVVIDKKKLVLTDDGQSFTYLFKKDVSVLRHITDVMNVHNSCIRAGNNFFRPNKKKVVMLTIGSRGDVQPFVSLGLELIDRGYDVKIVTHSCFEDFIKKHDIEFYPLSCDPRELMRLCISNSMISVNFVKDSLETFLPLIPSLLQEAWQGCKDANILISTPTSLAGYHIAEKLQIPFYNAFTMPFTYTNEQKNVMTMMSSKKEKQTWYKSVYNYLVEYVGDGTIWLTIRNNVNRWRVNTLGLHEKGYFEADKFIFHDQKIFTLYCYSSAIYQRPSDWEENIHVTGYWRNNVDENFSPSEDLQRFLRKHKNPVFVSFGSISLPNPEIMYKTLIRVCKRFNQPIIICKGWTQYDIQPEEMVFIIDEISYDFLLPYVKFMIHHGGAGTTASCVYHKKPMLIIPFFGDQFFWGSRISELGIGKVLNFKDVDPKDTSEGVLYDAIKDLVTSDHCQNMINKIGDIVIREDGIKNAINIIETSLQTSLVRPAHILDTETLKCNNIECERLFSVLGGILGAGRHHCRHCGNCFCGECSKHYITIPKYRYNKPVRVCNGCYLQLSNNH